MLIISQDSRSHCGLCGCGFVSPLPRGGASRHKANFVYEEPAKVSFQRFLKAQKKADGSFLSDNAVGHVTGEDFDAVLTKTYGSITRGMTVDVKKTTWNDIGGLGNIKQVRDSFQSM